VTTTSAFLAANAGIRPAFVLLVEGVPYAFTTAADTAAMQTAYAGTSWAGGSATFLNGLRLIGSIGQSIELFNPKINPDSLRFQVVDYDGSFAGFFFRSVPATFTRLTADLTPSGTTANVEDTSAFAAAGTGYCGNETITWTGKTATTLTGLTRGKWSLYSTESAAPYSYRHDVDPETGAAPMVSTAPRAHYNRGVQLWMHHWEGGAWATKANARLLWSGRIKSIADTGARVFSIEARSVLELIESCSLMEDQFRADLVEGTYLTASIGRFAVREIIPGTSNNYATDVVTTHALPARFTHVEVRADISESLARGGTIGAAMHANSYWTLAGRGNADHYSIQARSVTYTTDTILLFGASKVVWLLLGWDASGTEYTDPTTGDELVLKQLQYVRSDGSGFTFELRAPNAAVRYMAQAIGGSTLAVENVQGTWSDQPTVPTLPSGVAMPDGTTGMVCLGDTSLIAGHYTDNGDGTGTFYSTRNVTQEFLGLGFAPAGNPNQLPVVREDETGSFSIRQIWYERDQVASVLLRLLLSTGTAAFNSTSYDQNGVGMGAAVPYSLVSVNTLLGLGKEPFTLLLDGSTPLAKVVESALVVSGNYLVFRQGLLAVVSPRLDGAGVAASVALTESNKARRDDRVLVESSPDGIVNGVEIKYARDFSGTFRKSVVLRQAESRSDFGQRRTEKIEAWGAHDETLDETVRNVAAVALARFSRPYAKVTRSINHTLVDLVPGDPVQITDRYMLDSVTGNRGVTSLPGWALAVSFDFEKDAGEITVVTFPELDPSRVATWAPAARVDDTAGGGGYNAGTKVVTCYAHKYSHTAEPADASYFVIGDKVRVRELSPANPAAPQLWSDTVAGVSGNAVTLTTGLGGFVAATHYVLEYDAIATAGLQAAQRQHAFIADDADGSTGFATTDAYLWGAPPASLTGTLPATDYAEQFCRPSDTIDDKGRPLTVADWVELQNTLNNLWAHKTRSCLIQQHIDNPSAVVAGNWKLGYGPIAVPLYGHGRALKWRARIATNTAGAGKEARVRMVTSTALVSGASDTATEYDERGETVTTETSLGTTTPTWTAEQTHAGVDSGPVSSLPGDPPWVWVTFEYQGQGTATATLYDVMVYEDAGS
jgi:hypothetical protein